MLITTIHDVAPPMLDQVRDLRARLARWGVARVTLLAIPDYHRRGALAASPSTATWLRGQAAGGDEVALHGLIHRQDAPITRRRDRVRAALFTAGEGEMLGRGAADPARLAAARTALADLVDAPVAGFVAPAWLEGPTLPAVLAALGFGWHETAWRIERLRPGRPGLTTPVIGFATRSWWRARAACAWAAALAPMVCAGPVVRVALHPADVTRASVMAGLERVVRRAVATHAPVTTAGALDG
ncbi:MAG: DUF2334 domain-containing protein [Kofleriaceae bacterium]